MAGERGRRVSPCVLSAGPAGLLPERRCSAAQREMPSRVGPLPPAGLAYWVGGPLGLVVLVTAVAMAGSHHLSGAAYMLALMCPHPLAPSSRKGSGFH